MMMHDSDEEEEQTALVCDNGTFFSSKKQKIFNLYYTFYKRKILFYCIESKSKKWNN